jgi:hypothetical protein
MYLLIISFSFRLAVGYNCYQQWVATYFNALLWNLCESVYIFVTTLTGLCVYPMFWYCIGCSFKFILVSWGWRWRVDCERTTGDTSRISSFFELFVFFLCRRTSGAFTITSSAPALRINLINEHPIFCVHFLEIKDTSCLKSSFICDGIRTWTAVNSCNSMYILSFLDVIKYVSSLHSLKFLCYFSTGITEVQLRGHVVLQTAHSTLWLTSFYLESY